jgi:siderophore synthetase component
MSSEDFNRNMEIVAAHLASITVKQEQQQEAQARAEARLDRSEARLDRIERVLGAAIRLGSRQVREMRAAITRLTEAQAHTDAKMSETDERLNILVNTVERYISERRNGNGGNGPAGSN